MPFPLSDRTAIPRSPRVAIAIVVMMALAVPITLLCDYSWESTVGIDRFWAWPHVANYLAILIAAGAALALVERVRGHEIREVRIGRWRAPLGAWVVLWGAVAFATAVVFDRWWQDGYGLIAGIWHPPQLLKASAFCAVIGGAWMCSARLGGAARAGSAAAMIGLISVMALPLMFANRQHDALFYQVAAAIFPLLLTAAAVPFVDGPSWPATRAALIYMASVAVCVWLLPLLPGFPIAGPIFHPRETLLPPPFPLLLVLPAVAIDLLMRWEPRHPGRWDPWAKAAELGLAFTLIFIAAQWTFSTFLLSPAADHPLFAGGGKQWPFFLQVTPAAQTAFWNSPARDLDPLRGLGVAVLTTVSARLGLFVGRLLKSCR